MAVPSLLTGISLVLTARVPSCHLPVGLRKMMAEAKAMSSRSGTSKMNEKVPPPATSRGGPEEERYPRIFRSAPAR